MAGIISAAVPPHGAYAAQITDRSLTLQAGTTDGGSKPSGTVNHQFTFTLPTSGQNLGSIQFQYCTTASGTCNPVTGLVTTGAALGTTTGAATFSSVNNATAGAPYASRTAASFAGGSVTIQLTGIVNPSTPNQAFFVRISSYASTDATGTPIDTGTVAASTATQIQLTGIMPESLIFCTGATITAPGGIPDCSTAGSGNINFNQLFSPTDTATATSQMAASTNASSGYSITVNGATLTSGSNTIQAMGTVGTSAHGTGQFGMNLMANTTPAIGTDTAPAANGTNLKGEPAAGYGTVDNFKFASGNPVADSFNGGAGPTDAQLFTASYIVNVPGSQTAGTYVATLTYICTATF